MALRATLLATAACALQPKLPTRTTTRRSTMRMAWNDAATCKVCFVRHGQSEWNAKNLFTGWADVPLTILGKNEAAAGATWIWKEGLEFDVAYTSELKRAQQTLKLVMDITGQNDLTVHKSWRLNERMYGALQGLNKKETVLKYGDDQVRSPRFDVLRWFPFVAGTRVCLTSMRVVSFSSLRPFGHRAGPVVASKLRHAAAGM